MVPIDYLQPGIQEIEDIGPVTPLVLQDIELAPDQLLDRDGTKRLTQDRDLRPTGQPGFVNLGSLIGHSPDGIHNDVALAGPVDPGAVICLPVEVVGEPCLTHYLDHGRAVLRPNIDVEVLGVAKLS